MTSDAKPFFTPDHGSVAKSRMADFIRFVAGKVPEAPTDWFELSRWAVDDFRGFWAAFLSWAGVVHQGEPEPVCIGDHPETARFFETLSLSYTEHCIGPRPFVSDDATALVAVDETGRRASWTRRELRQRVEATARSLQAMGIGPGDHVAAIARNDESAVIACLATVGLGATWSSIGPDQGAPAILARFSQIEPKMLFTVSSYPYQGTRQSMAERIAAVVPALSTLEHVVILDNREMANEAWSPATTTLDALEAAGRREQSFLWPLMPFNHPLFVMFSSGTTGAPKCIVHGAGGTLLEHLKEHRLHSDLGTNDRLLFTTTCGWMMWNWQLTALASGTTVVAYDGSPTHPAMDSLWGVVSNERVSVFGTSPAFLSFCEQAEVEPGAKHDLSGLRAIQSTGSVLHGHHYDWVRDHVGKLPIQSISGGTDIIGCFVLGNPMLSVWAGESQSISLGLDVRSLLSDGTFAEPGDGLTGELVCVNPFPSRPVGFLNDPDGQRYHDAYFAENDGYWTHGDFLRLTKNGGAQILGRSDGIMNIRGIRIGPAEIYAALESIPEILAPMAVAQDLDDGGARVILLVVLQKGSALDRALTLRIKREIANRTSRVHVPGVIVAVDELPTTHNGKLSERAARDAVNGRQSPNRHALRNPGVLDFLLRHPELGGQAVSRNES